MIYTCCSNKQYVIDVFVESLMKVLICEQRKKSGRRPKLKVKNLVNGLKLEL